MARRRHRAGRGSRGERRLRDGLVLTRLASGRRRRPASGVLERLHHIFGEDVRLFLVVDQRLVFELGGVEHDVTHAVDAIPIFDHFFFGEQVSERWIDVERRARNDVVVVVSPQIAFELFRRQLRLRGRGRQQRTRRVGCAFQIELRYEELRRGAQRTAVNRKRRALIGPRAEAIGRWG